MKKGITVLILLILLAYSKLLAQEFYSEDSLKEIPADSFGIILRYTIRAINSSQLEATREYVGEVFAEEYLERVPLEDQVGKIAVFSKRTGGVQFVSFTKVDTLNRTYEIALKDNLYGLVHSLSLRLDEYGKINRWLNSLAPKALAEEHKLGASEKEIIKNIQYTVEHADKEDGFSGVVYIAKQDKVLYAKAFGMASKAYQHPNAVDTKFSAASLQRLPLHN